MRRIFSSGWIVAFETLAQPATANVANNPSTKLLMFLIYFLSPKLKDIKQAARLVVTGFVYKKINEKHP